jgi:hypothetical protein
MAGQATRETRVFPPSIQEYPVASPDQYLSKIGSLKSRHVRREKQKILVVMIEAQEGAHDSIGVRANA